VSDLVAFLRARLDEIEAAAKAATSAPWSCQVFHGGTDHAEWVVTGSTGSQAVITGQVGVGWMAGMPHDGEHIALHDPARVLREVRAKRRILFLLEAAQKKADAMPGDGSLEHAVTKTTVTFLLTVAQTMATAYDDHPGYDRAWDPGWETQP